MNVIGMIIIIILFMLLIICLYVVCFLFLGDKLLDKEDVGRNHCGIVAFNCSCGDIHFDEMSEEEIYNRLKLDYSVFHRFTQSFNKSHLAEYRIFTKLGKVKTIGYITKDKVVFEGKEYRFKEFV